MRHAIATYLNLERGAKATPEQILILSSTRQALFLCAQLLADVGKPILLENPGYFGAKKAFEAAEARIVPIDVDAHGIRTDLLRADRSGAPCVYVTPSHQYPTGATLSLERRLDLIHWAQEHQKWIIEDDYDSEFHYDGLPTACVQGLDKYQRTIYLGTFSKTLYPGLRMGYMVLPPHIGDGLYPRPQHHGRPYPADSAIDPGAIYGRRPLQRPYSRHAQTLRLASGEHAYRHRQLSGRDCDGIATTRRFADSVSAQTRLVRRQHHSPGGNGRDTAIGLEPALCGRRKATGVVDGVFLIECVRN